MRLSRSRMSGATSILYLSPAAVLRRGALMSIQMLSLPPGALTRFFTSPPASAGAGKPKPISAGLGRSVMYFSAGFAESGVIQLGLLGSRLPKPNEGRWYEG